MTVTVTGGGQVLVDVEKTLELVLADVDGVGVGLGVVVVVVVVVGSGAIGLEDDVSIAGLVLEAGSGEVEVVVVVVVVGCAGTAGDDEEDAALSVDELGLAAIELLDGGSDDGVEEAVALYDVVTKYSVVIPLTTAARFLSCANWTFGEYAPLPATSLQYS